MAIEPAPTAATYRCDTRSSELWPWRCGEVVTRDEADVLAARARDMGGLARIVLLTGTHEIDLVVDRRPKVWVSPLLGARYVTDDGGGLVSWPAVPGGWALREPFADSIGALTEVPGETAAETGWPHARLAPR